MSEFVDVGCIRTLNSTTLSGIHASNYLESADTTSIASNAILKKIGFNVKTFSVAALLATSGTHALSVNNSINTSPQPIKAPYEVVVNKVGVYQLTSDDADNKVLRPAELSDMLQSGFGFSKVSPWARVLKVERKTIYDWRKRPDTDVQPRIADRLNTLKALYDEMEPSHRKFVYAMAFGRRMDQGFADELLSAEMSKEKLSEIYDDLFLDFVGLDKRDELNNS